MDCWLKLLGVLVDNTGMSTTAERLYRAAILADDAFSAALKAAGFDRWNSDHGSWPVEVREAYTRKVAADKARRGEPMTDQTTAARVHRFHETVALFMHKTGTAYLSAPLARKIGEALVRYADDIELFKFTESNIGDTEYGDYGK